MRTVADQESRAKLVARLRKLTPDTPRRWGTMTAAEMLCHLGDAGDSVLQRRIPPGPPPSGRRRPFIRWLVVYSPIPWPKGFKTRPGVNPKIDGTRPGDFERDRARVIGGLEALAVASGDQLSKVHYVFGPATPRDWQHWAWRHVNHHLRQFGL